MLIDDDFKGGVTKAILVYTACIAIALFCFGNYQLWCLGVQNTAGNEDIRRRWNGHKNNKRAA